MVEAITSLLGANVLSETQVRQLLTNYRYQEVFIFPPWEDIYCVDDERDHTFEHSVNVHQSILEFYRRYKYDPVEVPLGPVTDRVGFILERSCKD